MPITAQELKLKEQEPTQQIPIAPWYKQFWAWFVLAPLLVVIVVCAMTVTLAFYYADDVVIDNYYKEGRLINQRLEQDQRAGQLGLEGELRFDLLLGEIHLSLQTDKPAVLPTQLLVLLDHPTLSRNDHSLLLTELAPGHYRAELEPSLQTRLRYRWYVYVMPITDPSQRNQAPWRLLGELDFQLSDRLQIQADEQYR